MNSSTNLTYGNTYRLSCLANNSRPSISLSIFADNINLNEFSNSSVQILNSSSQCDPNMTCTTILELNVTFNDQLLYTIGTISCNAFNTTMPYNLNITETFNVHMDIPSNSPPSIISVCV
jgi:hypothetical protein